MVCMTSLRNCVVAALSRYTFFIRLKIARYAVKIHINIRMEEFKFLENSVTLCQRKFMKRIALLFLLAIGLNGCQDGDIITSTFDFEDTALQFCGGPGGYLFFKLNEAQTESISVRLGTSEQLFLQSDTLEVNLNNSTNFVNFRTFDGTVSADYFCNEVPPTEPKVTSEYVAYSGIARLITVTTYDDNDGIDSEDEMGMDSDGDGLPNRFDFDDDGDNVPTLLEIDNEDLDGDGDPLTNPKDTDGDGIPDYLDEDDDGDGILTRYEDIDEDLNPTNNITDPTVGPDYLNPDITESAVVDAYREHEYDFSSDVRLTLKNIALENGNETITKETLVLGEYLNILSGTLIVTPNFD